MEDKKSFLKFNTSIFNNFIMYPFISGLFFLISRNLRDMAYNRCQNISELSRCGARKFSFTAPCQDTCQAKKFRFCLPHPGCYCPDDKIYDEKTKRCVLPDECPPNDGEGGDSGGGSFGFNWGFGGSK